MNISEPAAVEQQRAVPRGLFARSLACACLMLMALASRDLAAQEVAVTFLPGEVTKEVPMPRFATTIRITTPPNICNWPTVDRVRNSFSTDAAELALRLAQMESFGTASLTNIVGSMNAFTGISPIRLSAGTSMPVPPPSETNISLPFMSQCLEVDTARASVNELRRIIRAYLGMPPPTRLIQN